MATLARVQVTQLPRMPLLYIMEYLQPHEALQAGELLLRGRRKSQWNMMEWEWMVG